FVPIANSAMPDPTASLLLASWAAPSETPSTLRKMLEIDIGQPDSPVTHLIRASTPSPVFGVTKAGWVAAGGDSPSAPLTANPPSPITSDAIDIWLGGSVDSGWIAWRQGNGTGDWRLGRPSDGSQDLALYSAAGAASAWNAPGTKMVRFAQAGN